MHAAAYALDPQSMHVPEDIDSHSQNGLMKMQERTCIRDVILEEKLDVSSAVSLSQATTTIQTTHPDDVKRVAKGGREFAACSGGKLLSIELLLF